MFGIRLVEVISCSKTSHNITSGVAMAVPDVKEVKLDGERRKALNLAISQIEKQLGKGSIMRMGTDSPRERVVAISTGAINLDAATGIGGLPRGRTTGTSRPQTSRS